MVRSTSAYLIARLDDLERYASDLPEDLLDSDLETVAKEVLSFIVQCVDLRQLDERLAALFSLDIDALREGLRLLREEDLGPPLVLSERATIVPGNALDKASDAIDYIEEKASSLTEFALAAAIDLRLGSALEHALLCAVSSGRDLQPLLDLAGKKLALLDDDQLVLVWTHMQREWDPNRHFTMKDPDSLLPKGFLKFESKEVARTRLAEYVVRLRPSLILAMVRDGFSEVPVEMDSLARILTWSSSDASEPVSQEEVLLASSISRLAFLLQKRFYKRAEEVAALVRIRPDGRILTGPEFQDAQAAFSTSRPAPQPVFFELRKAVRIADSFITYEAPIERALQQYKLGLEVMAPEILRSFSGKGELLLQKELCRFLLERGIFTVGTKFGRSETDLFAEEPGEQFVLETKLFRRKRPLGSVQIKHALVQLQSYLDQSPSTPRGILILYNLTDSLVTAPNKWIQGRYWILPINLQTEPPSGRKRSLAIEPGSDDQLIEILSTEHKPRKG